MPNYCDNIIFVSGKASELKKFDDKFKAKHMEYSGGTTSSLKKDFKEEDYKEYIAYKTGPYTNMFASEEDKKERISITYIDSEEESEKYSFSNFVPLTKEAFLSGWHSWSCDNWGTKWDACDLEEDYVTGLDLLKEAVQENELDREIEIVYSFNTAWSPCSPVVKAMSKEFPDLKFIHHYDEPGCCFAGKDTLENGDYTESLESEGDDYRRFVVDNLDSTRYAYKCKNCGYPIDEYEAEEDEACPECEGKDFEEVEGY